MSNNELTKYQQEYSELIENLISLHNHNINFVKKPFHLDYVRHVRSSLRKILKNVQTMKNNTKLVYIEGIDNKRVLKQQLREEKKSKRKSNVDKRTTQRTV